MPTQKLYLSSDKPWDGLYTTEQGHTLYKTESPSPWKMAQYVKILRVIPSLASESNNTDALKDSFGLLAEIEYRVVHTDQIRYGGEEKSVNDFFRKKGFNFFGRNHIFTGPNGMEYVWKMESDTCKLFVNDSRETPVAVFHQQHGGLIRQARPAYLEIFAEGEHMIDLIVVTFVYMEKLRKELETAVVSGS